MTLQEYKNRLRGLRYEINTLSFALGNTYSTELNVTTKLLNECLNGDIDPSEGDEDIEYSLDIDLYKYPEKLFLVNPRYER